MSFILLPIILIHCSNHCSPPQCRQPEGSCLRRWQCPTCHHPKFFLQLVQTLALHTLNKLIFIRITKLIHQVKVSWSPDFLFWSWAYPVSGLMFPPLFPPEPLPLPLWNPFPLPALLLPPIPPAPLATPLSGENWLSCVNGWWLRSLVNPSQ